MPSLKKILMDLWANKSRTFLVTLSIAVGVFAVGLVTSSFLIVYDDMTADYDNVNPHTAMIFTDNFDHKLVKDLSTIPGVAAIDGRYNLWVKAADTQGIQYQINIHSIGPIDEIKVDQLTYAGYLPPLEENEIYLERQGCAGLGLEPGDNLELILNDGRRVFLKIAGLVHDVNANPFNFTSQTAGFVTPKTMEYLGGSELFNFVTFVTTGSHTDKKHIQGIANLVAQRMRENGLEVYNILVNNPGQHPAKSIIDTVIKLMGLLGVVSVLLSAFLVTNTISAVISQQVRQIGVMKAVGASFFQMVLMYMGLVTAYGLLALIIAVPLGALAAHGLTSWLITMLNATPSAFVLPLPSILIQILVALIIPIIGGLIPVMKGANMTVREAINDYGLSTPESRSSSTWVNRILSNIPRPAILTLRNTFRRKARLILTLSTLVMSGAFFIAVLNVRESLHLEVEQTAGYHTADVNINFPVTHPMSELTPILKEVPGMTRLEGWWIGKINILNGDGKNSDQVMLYAPPSETELVKPVITQGRWLTPADDDAVVVDNHFLTLNPDVKLGDRITLRMDRQDHVFTVIGFFRVSGNASNPSVYINYEALVKRSNQAEMVNSLRITTNTHDAETQNNTILKLQDSFSKNGIYADMQTGNDVLSQKKNQLDLLVYLLLLMAILIAIVGGLGLMGSMGINILERTREIGVMRSIGAVNNQIFLLVVSEGILIGMLSWLLSGVAALPVTSMLDHLLGISLMTIPLNYVYSLSGVLIWLGLILIISTVSSLIPAKNAVRMSVRDILAYE